MELKLTDPRSLVLNPENPRRTKASEDLDAQLTANIKAIGLIQPPRVKAVDGALLIIAGERRVKCAIAAGLTEIHVLISSDDDGADPVRALAENVQRCNMGPVDQWRAIEGLCGSGWSEDAIASAFSMTVRAIRKLRLLANIHPAMLNAMTFDLPKEGQLRIIAGASLTDQAAIFKKHKPRKGESVNWWQIEQGLRKATIPATVARFDEETAQAFGVTWTDDLFGPADEDNRHTADIEAFMAAQRHWMEQHLPKNGVMLDCDKYGHFALPPNTRENYGRREKGDKIGICIDPRSGVVREVAFRLVESATKQKKGKSADAAETETAKPSRPEITVKGQERIGDLRTDALHHALAEADFDDTTTLAMLIIAFAGDNLSVTSGAASHGYGIRREIAALLTEGGKLTSDIELIRGAARMMLTHVLSCREGRTNSGRVARVAGDAIGADAFLATMAEDDFLKCLSKPGIERAAREAGVAVIPKTGKEIRAALIAHVGQATYVLPESRFALTAAEQAAHANATARPAGGDDDEESYALGGEAGSDDDDGDLDAVSEDDDADGLSGPAMIAGPAAGNEATL